MNISIVVEGAIGEVQVYKMWVPFVNPSLKYVNHVSEIVNNNFSIISGGGQPYCYRIIDAAIEDINALGNIDRLVIAVDSEELDYEEKYREVHRHISGRTCSAEIRIVIQHFCLETWALGNRTAVRPHPQDGKLLEYMGVHNVRVQDPELLPGYEKEGLNRSQFAAKYLKKAMNDKFRNLTYSKNDPTPLLHPTYFQQVKQRREQTTHIASFSNFLQAFI